MWHTSWKRATRASDVSDLVLFWFIVDSSWFFDAIEFRIWWWALARYIIHAETVICCLLLICLVCGNQSAHSIPHFEAFWWVLSHIWYQTSFVEASRPEHLTLFFWAAEGSERLVDSTFMSTYCIIHYGYMIYIYIPSDWQIPTTVGASIQSAVSVPQEFVPKSEGESQCTGTVASCKWRVTSHGHGTLGCGGYVKDIASLGSFPGFSMFGEIFL